ncbi:transcription initiation factor IIE, beta subunit [Decorospora gaudefroyi]|uniref:Transcription initiation factor IIE subunit beta n=1 Tax=Decorospora gaudefroyi TaxID=184978 RepID=A0A6A5KFM5_9PLEO|nr:transcription initiation factor IIE, beta subunit [Decorospora gaudefroyi]
MSFLKAGSASAMNAPSPTPSNSSASGTKRKRPTDGAPPVVYSQPQDTGTGEHVFTRLTYVNDFLRERKDKWHSFDDIMGYLNIQPGHVQREQLRQLMRADNQGNRISWDKANEKYTYKPKLNIRNPAQLKGHLQAQKSAMGLQIKDLKDGWTSVADDITKMEDKKEVLVRRAKDGVPKTVWGNDASLMLPMDPVFAKSWHAVHVPDNPDELRKVLLANKLTAATQAKVIVPGKTTKKKKGPRRGGKQTNTHMIGILKDFSGMRK